jgi:glyoxylase-like metal-dependent hydrolase (beta-lactamase superfamily II)
MKCLHISVIVFCCLSFLYSQETSSVEISRLSSNLYKVTYNVGYLVNGVISFGEDGLLLVDTGGKETAEELKEKLKALGNNKPAFIINTHSHVDHTGGNAAFGRGPVIIAHKILRHRLQHGNYIIQEYPDDALPDIMITDSISLFFNGEEIRIIALPGSHDDSDIIVHFTKSGIAYLGDLAYGMSFPSVDYRTGNDAKYAEVVENAINLLPENTNIISGHGRDCSMDDMRRFQEMLERTTEIVRHALAEGKNVETMQKENILKDWNSFSNDDYIGSDYWISDLASDILDPSPKKSIIEPILIATNKGGPEAGVSEYYQLKNNNHAEYHFHAYRLYQLGRYLTEKVRYEDAIKILELNAVEYPEFWMTFDGLGEAHLKTGNNEEAIKNYKISLRLNSENKNAIQYLELLESKNTNDIHLLELLEMD